MVPVAAVENAIAELLPHLEDGDIPIDGDKSYYVDDIRRAKVGSADLGPSNKTFLTFPGVGDVGFENTGGRTLHFGVREHAMAAIVNDLTLLSSQLTRCSGLSTGPPPARAWAVRDDLPKHGRAAHLRPLLVSDARQVGTWP
jgi:6-phosphogluconate dehydrogenase